MRHASASGGRRQGGPLVALAAILGAWIVVRVAFVDMSALSPTVVPDGLLNRDLPQFAQGEPSMHAGMPVQGKDARSGTEMHASGPAGIEAEAESGETWRNYQLGVYEPAPLPLAGSAPAAPQPFVKPVPVEAAIGHHSLWMAALSKVPLPWQIAGARQAGSSAPFVSWDNGSSGPRRWSADAWLMLRRGGAGALASGAGPATYGGSQAGAVVRYRLDPGSPRKPAVYARATAALTGVTEQEVAVGLSARPVPSVPAVAAIEVRASRFANGTRARPAAFFVTELPRFDLPNGARADIYGQAGYVGGTFSTFFADGQARVDRRIAEFGGSELRAGAGTWAGAQKGARRIDIGPTATVGIDAGPISAARVALDWRFRIAGNARPQSGPALTLSAGF